MFIICNKDYEIVACQQELPNVTNEYTVTELTEYDNDYTGYILYDEMLIARPTPYHTASDGNWILTVENSLLLFQVVLVTCNKILSLCAFGVDDEFIQSVHELHHCKNVAKSYIKLKQLLANAPPYIAKEAITLE